MNRGFARAMLSAEKKMLLADASLIFAASLWGLFFIVSKDVLEVLSPLWAVFFRFGPAFVAMVILFPRRMSRFTPDELKGAVAMGGWTFLGVIAQMAALGLSTAGKTAFITAAYVIFTPLIPWIFLGRFPGRFVFFASLLCFAGIGLLAGGAAFAFNAGDALSLLAAVFFALQLLTLERFAPLCDTVRLTSGVFAVVGLLALVCALIFDGLPSVFDRGTRWLWGVGYSVLVATVFAMTLQTYAQKFTSSSHVAIACGTQGVFGAIFGVWLLGEPCTVNLILGGLLISTAIVLVELQPALPSQR